MHTECPECQTAFRVTAGVLRQANGQVRCGGCGHVFYALEHLFDDPTGEQPGDPGQPRDPDENRSSLVDSLDDLAEGEDVRIEDTGVEWRVLNVDDSDPESESDAASNDEGEDNGDNWSVERPLDLTAADDEDVDADEAAFAEASDVLTVGRDEDDSDNDAAATIPPDAEQHDNDDGDEREAEDEYEDEEQDEDPRDDAPVADPTDTVAQQTFDDDTSLPEEFYSTSKASTEWQDKPADADDGAAAEALRIAIDTGTEADWQELLDEVDDPAATVASDDSDELPETDDEPDDGQDEQQETSDETDNDRAVAEDDVDDDDSQEESDGNSESENDDAEADSAGSDDDANSVLVQSIVMEGETVNHLLEQAEHTSYDDVPPPEFDDDVQEATDADRNQRRWRRAGYAAIVLLILALAAQLVHANRQSLATQSFFQTTIGPVYDAFGQPVNPDWDVRGWQFESTSGNTDDANLQLSILSRISNHSETALPYPLLHVSLTDRFDEVIGSRILLPREYLAGAGNPGQPVGTGDHFTAVISINAPPATATGFKLNVCYPMSGERLRCAIEDFRD